MRPQPADAPDRSPAGLSGIPSTPTGARVRTGPAQAAGHLLPTLGESHLLWDYLDFCLGGRRGPSAYMPFSPGRIRRQSHSLSLPQDEEENLAKVTREIRKVSPSLKERLLAPAWRQSPRDHQSDWQWRQQRQRRGWASFPPGLTPVSTGSWQGQARHSHLGTRARSR